MILKKKNSKIFKSKTEPPNFELMPNEDFRKTLNLIKDIFDSYNNSVVSIDSKKDDYAQILNCVIEPMLQMASLSAINLPVIDMSVYMINCIYTIYSTLLLYEVHIFDLIRKNIKIYHDKYNNKNKIILLIEVH
jgi:hypothetical protein